MRRHARKTKNALNLTPPRTATILVKMIRHLFLTGHSMLTDLSNVIRPDAGIVGRIVIIAAEDRP
jgi:hypothetical protein